MPLDAFSPLHLQFAALAGSWYTILFTYATRLFQMLALVEIGLGAILWMQAQQSGDHVGMGLFRKILWIGFMYAVLLFSHEWIPAVVNSFMEAGAQASGVAAINPGEVFLQGLGLTGSMLANLLGLNLLFQAPATLAGIGAAFIVFFSFCAIAIMLSYALMESYVVIGAGVFLLGFGAFRGTVNISEKYLSYVVSVGIKLFVIYLMLGAGGFLAELWQGIINDRDVMKIASAPLAIAGGALLYGVATWMLPSLAASMISGAVGFGIQEVMGAITMTSRLATTGLAGTAALGAGAWAAGGIAKDTAKLNGGGAMGMIKGLGAGAGALGREAMNAAVPRLGRGVQNLQRQRSQMGGKNNQGGNTP